MKGFLILCSRDWLHPKSGAVEHYVHEVFSRVARRGYYVAWVSHQHFVPGSGAKPSRKPGLADGIQIARLGFRAFYRTTATLFVSRMMKSGMLADKFEAVIDCVNGRPLSFDNVSDVPVMPLVFRLRRGIKASEAPPGPVIAATATAHHQLAAAGLPEEYIVRAPYGVDCELYSPPDTLDGAGLAEAAPVVAVDERPKCLLGALKRLQREGLAPRVNLLGNRTQPPRLRGSGKELLAYRPMMDPVARAPSYREARLGYCGPGHEMEALAFAACRVPAICPATPAAEEFVENGETGLLHPPGNAAVLADLIRRLITDDALRNRLAANAYKRAQGTTWDKTAGLILATIRNL